MRKYLNTFVTFYLFCYHWLTMFQEFTEFELKISTDFSNFSLIIFHVILDFLVALAWELLPSDFTPLLNVLRIVDWKRKKSIVSINWWQNWYQKNWLIRELSESWVKLRPNIRRPFFLEIWLLSKKRSRTLSPTITHYQDKSIKRIQELLTSLGDLVHDWQS